MKKATVERILDAAEVEFGAHGFVETSLRTITGKAGVNLAAVNYHFGSKKGLIQAVTDRFFEPLTVGLQAHLQELAKAEISHHDALVQIYRGLLLEALRIAQGNPARLVLFARLVNSAYNQSQGHLRKHLTHQYAPVFMLFIQAMREHMPSMDHEQFFWRFHQLMGMMVFTLSNSEALTAICAAEYAQQRGLPEIVQQLIATLVAAAEAPVVAIEKLA
ncbi:MAG: TetR family transcriptional regulator [Gammaproteobacteria bacterium]|nr:TetR family transcriptional regulator [Gammaproteobacteria bacterium]